MDSLMMLGMVGVFHFHSYGIDNGTLNIQANWQSKPIIHGIFPGPPEVSLCERLHSRQSVRLTTYV